jgi:hypothetical protein
MNPGQNEDHPDSPQGLATDDGKAARPPEMAPTAAAASRRWPLARKILRIVTGVLLLLLGLAALFTPFTPGSWLALVGLEFLGLRVLLRNWVCARARAKPQSRFLRLACRIFSMGHRNATKPRWWRRFFRRTPDVRSDEPRRR